MPTCAAIAFWVILRKPRETVAILEEKPDSSLAVIDVHKVRRISKISIKCDTKIECGPPSKDDTELKCFKEKLLYMPSLLKFIIPLVLVFLFEYVISSGLVSGFFFYYYHAIIAII